MNQAELISICVCSCRRPELLARLLDSLADQPLPGFAAEVVVVDNDAAGSAEAAVLAARLRHPLLPIRYAVEPRPGVSFARNRCVSLAQGGWLAFIDDDEEAGASWLAEAWACLGQHQADAVLGPVLPVYPQGTPAWVVQSGFFERPRFASGTPLPANQCRMGNALIRRDWLGEHPFDEALARSGGEDSAYFMRIIAAGARVVWCDSACVTELVPLPRQQLGWMLSRSLRASTTYWRLVNPARPRWRRAASALLGVLASALFALAGLIALAGGRARALGWWRRAAGGLGRALALTGIKTHGYGGSPGG